MAGRRSPVTYAGGVLRSLISPRWLGLSALLVALVSACTLLGLWQLGVARDEGLKEVVAQAGSSQRAPLPQVLAPHAAFPAELSNRLVEVTGTYAPDRSLVVTDRRLADRPGAWVVTPLVTDDGTIAVLRGFVLGSPTVAPTPPTGVVTVAGSLGPGESPRGGQPLAAPQVRSIDLAALVNAWPGELYNAVVFASDERVGGAPVAAAGLDRVPAPSLSAPLNFKNAAYAVQWWAFGLFAIWMWWKMFRAEQQEPLVERAPQEEVTA